MGPTVQSHTKGFWLCSMDHPNDPDKCLLLLDTEGLGDVERGSSTHDTKLFSLAILLSSVLVYNGMGTIDGDAVKQLHFVSELTDHIRMQADKDEEGFEFSQVFPSFIWVVRDFTLELEINGKSCTEDEYLEHALKIKPGNSKETKKFNDIKETLRQFFPKRRCFTFCKPVDDKLLKELEAVPEQDLFPEFLQKADQFCSTIFKDGDVFRVGGVAINGPRLLLLVQQYVKALNDGAVPCIGSAVDLMRETECQRAIDLAVKVYKEDIENDIVPKLPMTSSDLSTQCKAIYQKAIDVYIKESLFDEKGEHQKKLLRVLTEEYGKITAENASVSKKKCKDLLNELYEPIANRITRGEFSGNGSYQEYENEYKAVLKKYQDTPNKGPCADEILLEFNEMKENEKKAILAADKALQEADAELAKINIEKEQETIRAEAEKAHKERVELELEDTKKNTLEFIEQEKMRMEEEIKKREEKHLADMKAKEYECKRFQFEGALCQANMMKELISAMEDQRRKDRQLSEERIGQLAEQNNKMALMNMELMRMNHEQMKSADDRTYRAFDLLYANKNNDASCIVM